MQLHRTDVIFLSNDADLIKLTNQAEEIILYSIRKLFDKILDQIYMLDSGEQIQHCENPLIQTFDE